MKRTSSHFTDLLSRLPQLILLTALLLLAGVGTSRLQAEVYEYDLNQNLDTAYFQVFGNTGGESYSRLTDEGLHIQFESAAQPSIETGIKARFPLEGDFTLTGTYEIKQLTKPDQGYGAGATLRLNEVSGFQAQLKRVWVHNRGNVFKSDWAFPPPPERSKPGSTSLDHKIKYLKTESQKGKIRLQRTGEEMIWFVSEGDTEEFQEMRKESFPTGRVYSFELMAESGRGSATVDFLWKHLTVETSAPLPDLTKPETTSAPSSRSPAGSNTSIEDLNWRMILLVISVLILVGSLVYLIVKKK
ncbi:MAG: DUF1583 domain-containing protein [Planctomycetaceae bacterium]